MRFGDPHWRAGFSRTDLLAVIVALVVLGELFFAFIWRSRSSATTAVCASNLKQLGAAMAMYEQENGGRLPYAFLRFGSANDYSYSKDVWDSLIFPHVPLNQAGLSQKHFLRCPADTLAGVEGQTRRTYAMPSHSIQKENWPLSPENATGIGVWWDSSLEKRADLRKFISVHRTPANGEVAESTSVTMPAINFDMIHAPGSTLLLTEYAWPENTAFNFHGAVIDSVEQHVAAGINLDKYHSGKINYLMVDSHVECLYPLESIGQADPRDGDSRKEHPDIWTIRPDD